MWQHCRNSAYAPSATGAADDRIVPIPCGEKEWETDDSRPILEVARREGIEVEV